MELVWNFVNEFVAILCEMAPYLLLGFLFAGLLYAFLPQHTIRKYFGGSPFASSARAAMLGVPLPLCSCGVIPTGMALYKNGASKGSTVSFLISTPQTGIDSILATYSMMGLPFAIIRPLTAFVTGILGGWVEGCRSSRADSVSQADLDVDNGENYFNDEEGPRGNLLERLILALKYGFFDFLIDIAKWLLVGLVLAAAISALVPKDFVASLNLPVIVQMLLLLVIAIPLYVCATGSIPLAAAFIALGVNPGAAFVFLMAGPATNAATITVLNKVLGTRTLITYLVSIICGAMAAGLAIAYLLPGEWFVMSGVMSCCHHGGTEAIDTFSLVCGIALLILIVGGFAVKALQSRKAMREIIAVSETESQVATFVVSGMTCSHCKANVERAVKSVEGVETSVADINTGTLVVSGASFDPQVVSEAIIAAGYKVKDKSVI